MNPLFDNTTLTVGRCSVTIPSNLFHENSRGYYVYEGTINGEHLEVVIVPSITTPSSFTLTAEGSGVSMGLTQNPTLVELMIGHHTGTQAVRPHN